MSFSKKVNDEIINLDSEKTEKISLLSSYLRNNAVITNLDILINTENIEISKYIFNLFKELYDVTPQITVRKSFNFKKSMSYLLKIKDKKDIILKDLSLINDEGYFINIPRIYIYEDDEDKKAYLRGLFLSTGSINDPKTSRYHLEFIINNEEFANFLRDILNSYELNAKTLRRAKGYMVYIKESEKISDLLRVIKAYNAVLYYEDIRVLREKQNMNNRINNCEQANVEKSMASSNKQIEDINFIKVEDAYDLLDEKVRKVADYRLKYPESSLIELSKIISVETGETITKSCVNHRLRKIRELADRLRESK